MCFFSSKELAVKLKSQLEEMRRTKELQESQALESGESRRSEEIVVLTRTDAAGNIRPLEMTTERKHRGKRKKRQKVSILVGEKTNFEVAFRKR